MKKLITLIFILLFISCKKNNENGIGNNQYAVQDFGKLFSNTEKNNLTKKILNFKKGTTNEICIYTLDSLPENIDEIEILATKLAFDIGIDTNQKNNGLLLLISEHDSEFAFVRGKDTKKFITDSIRDSISKNYLIPYFSEGEYYKGIINSLDAIMSVWDK